jgi:hypothetical protein
MDTARTRLHFGAAGPLFEAAEWTKWKQNDRRKYVWSVTISDQRHRSAMIMCIFYFLFMQVQSVITGDRMISRKVNRVKNIRVSIAHVVDATD